MPLSGFASHPSAEPIPEKKEDGPINISSNENPYGPSPAARKAMADAIGLSNRYQWETIRKLMAAIGAKNNLTNDNVLVGAGSSEILDFCVQYAATEKGSFVVANPTFDRWSGSAEKQGLKKIAVPLTKDKHHDLNAMLKAIQPDTRMVYICNPNNPTATICDHNAIVSFVEEATKKTLVVVDEAYLSYTTEPSLCNLVASNKNLVVVKTFSKVYGLAGSRVGYALAHTETIERMGQLRAGANIGVSAVTMAGALASLDDNEFVSSTFSLNEKARNFTITELERLHISCIPSHTNFIYFSLVNYKPDFFERLKTHNIMGTGIFEEEGKWSRITVGTMGEMEKFIAAIK